MSEPPYPVAIDYIRNVCIFSDDAVFSISNWIDENGVDCSPDAAVVCVTGEDGYGWYSIHLREYHLEHVH